MKLVQLATGIDATAALIATFSQGSVKSISIPAQAGRTKTQLAEEVANLHPGFVLNGTTATGVVADDFSNASFDEIGTITLADAIDIAGVSVSKNIALPAAGFLVGLLVGNK